MSKSVALFHDRVTRHSLGTSLKASGVSVPVLNIQISILDFFYKVRVSILKFETNIGVGGYICINGI